MKRIQPFSALFSFPGFRAHSRLQGIFGDSPARLVTLVRRKKRPCVRAEHTVKDLDTQYLRAWLAQTPQPAPRVICVDELSIKKGHTSRIVVSDLE